MAVLFIRTIIFYVSLVIFLRIMGKRQIGELQPTEFAVTLLIADLAAIPMQSASIPLINGIIPIAVLLIIEMTLSVLTLKFRKVRTIISGHPMTVIENGEINRDVMKKLRFNTDDLCEELRLQGIDDLNNVSSAVVETNGKLSIFTKGNGELFYTLISDGKADRKVMENLNISEKELQKMLRSSGYKSENEVFLLCRSKSGKVFIEGKK